MQGERDTLGGEKATGATRDEEEEVEAPPKKRHVKENSAGRPLPAEVFGCFF